MNRGLSDTETRVCLKSLCVEDGNIADYQQKRYRKLCNDFKKYFGEAQVRYFSSPGRTELSGNHTDHNNGQVIAASINLDSIACVSENDSEVEIFSNGFNELFKVNLNNLNPVEKEIGTTSALIRGIAAGLSKRGYKIGGFKACI